MVKNMLLMKDIDVVQENLKVNRNKIGTKNESIRLF